MGIEMPAHMPTNYKVRLMKLEDIALALNWAAKEGWNPGIYDAEAFWAADPTGFFIGELDGEAVSTYSAVKYGSTFSFHGFYIVKSEYRKKGLGLPIWNRGRESVGARIIGGDAVVQNVHLYEKFGLRSDYRTLRFGGNFSLPSFTAKNIVDAREVSFNQLLKYDRFHFPEERPAFLRAWMTQPEAISLASTVQGEIRGYINLRKCFEGYRVGPLFAENSQTAKNLLLTALSRISQDSSVMIDVPEPNIEALQIISSLKLKQVFETVRMYSGGPAPVLPLRKIYGVTTLELG
jgi:hypothetical protein